MNEKENTLVKLNELSKMLINLKKDLEESNELQEKFNKVNSYIDYEKEEEIPIPDYYEKVFIFNKKTYYFYSSIFALLAGLLTSIFIYSFTFGFFIPLDYDFNIFLFIFSIFLSYYLHDKLDYPSHKLNSFDLVFGLIVIAIVIFPLYHAVINSKVQFLIMYLIFSILLFFLRPDINLYSDKLVISNEKEVNEAIEIKERNKHLVEVSEKAKVMLIEIKDSIDQLNEKIKEKNYNILNFTNGWYYEKYLNLNMVSIFIYYIKSGRADNLKEAIKCYDEDVFKAEQLKLSSEMLKSMNNQVELQSSQNELLQRNNEIQNNTNTLLEKNVELHNTTNSLLEKNNELQSSNNRLLKDNLRAQEKTQRSIDAANIMQAVNNSLLQQNNSLLSESKRSIDYNNALSKDISRKLK